jgi:hypothetical protein
MVAEPTKPSGRPGAAAWSKVTKPFAGMVALWPEPTTAPLVSR